MVVNPSCIIRGDNMNFVDKCWNTISCIEYSNSYKKEEFQKKFDLAIMILTRRARNYDDSEFTNKELAILEYVFNIITIYG